MIRIPVGFCLMIWSVWHVIKAVFIQEHPGQTVSVSDLPNATIGHGDHHWHIPPSVAGWLILFAIGCFMFCIRTGKERKLGK
jgi:hypothetical protein